MANIKVLNMAGKEVGEISLSDAVFGAEVNSAVLHIAVKSYLANQIDHIIDLVETLELKESAPVKEPVNNTQNQ